MHYRNVNDRKEAIKNIKRLIRRKEKENEQLDADLEELALSVAERRNVNEANGTWNMLLCCSQPLYGWPFISKLQEDIRFFFCRVYYIRYL